MICAYTHYAKLVLTRPSSAYQLYVSDSKQLLAWLSKISKSEAVQKVADCWGTVNEYIVCVIEMPFTLNLTTTQYIYCVVVRSRVCVCFH